MVPVLGKLFLRLNKLRPLIKLQTLSIHSNVYQCLTCILRPSIKLQNMSIHCYMTVYHLRTCQKSVPCFIASWIPNHHISHSCDNNRIRAQWRGVGKSSEQAP